MTLSSALQLCRLPKRTNIRIYCSEGYFIFIIIIIFLTAPRFSVRRKIQTLTIFFQLAGQSILDESFSITRNSYEVRVILMIHYPDLSFPK